MERNGRVARRRRLDGTVHSLTLSYFLCFELSGVVLYGLCCIELLFSSRFISTRCSFWRGWIFQCVASLARILVPLFLLVSILVLFCWLGFEVSFSFSFFCTILEIDVVLRCTICTFYFGGRWFGIAFLEEDVTLFRLGFILSIQTRFYASSMLLGRSFCRYAVVM